MLQRSPSITVIQDIPAGTLSILRNRRELAGSSRRLAAYFTSAIGPADRQQVSGIRTGVESDKTLQRKALQGTAPYKCLDGEVRAGNCEPENVRHCNQLRL